MKLLLFNPETEYALASGASFYTPPARVEKLRIENQLLPEMWADLDDFILVDNVDDFKSKFKLVQWDMLASLFKEYPQIKIDPWGWNHALLRKFRNNGVPDFSLPDKESIDLIRELAHRRTTIKLNSLWNDKVGDMMSVDIPVELRSVEQCIGYLRSSPGCWMKAPWSSSGRGVINTAADMTEELVAQWCRGIIRRQGCVMGESGANRRADYATEWRMKDGVALYAGLSYFTTSNRGKYIDNFNMSQNSIEEEFCRMYWPGLRSVIEIQKPILEIVFGKYEGPLGVDMIVEQDGRIRPFVEVNLRHTMGMVYINDK